MNRVQSFCLNAVAGRCLVTLALFLNAPLSAQEQQEPARLLTVWAGMLPIILSAPHGGREPIPGVPIRRGTGVPQFTTERDSNTAELAEALANAIGDRLDAKPFLIIARFERKYVDANRPYTAAYESTAAKLYYEAYHRALEEAAERVRQQFTAGILLDIHGQGAEANTIFRGTDNGRSVSALEKNLVKKRSPDLKALSGRWHQRVTRLFQTGSAMPESSVIRVVIRRGPTAVIAVLGSTRFNWKSGPISDRARI